MPKKNKKKVNKAAKPSQDSVAVTASCSQATTNKRNVQYLENPVKSVLDMNKYRVILLPNGLKVTLVAVAPHKIYEEGSWQSSEYYQIYKDAYGIEKGDCKTWCNLCVNVGTMNNPRKVPGVSSLVWKTIQNLFDSKYQEPNNYGDSKRCSAHVNEFWEETIYEVDIGDAPFYETLKEFVQPFISIPPTRYNVKTQREKLEELNKNGELSETLPGTRDGSRTFLRLATTRHPMRATENSPYESLCQISDDKLYREVVKFYKRHYSANRMTVYLQAVLPLDTLETYAVECLSKIPNNNLPPQNFRPFDFSNSFDNTKFRRIWITDKKNSSPKMSVHWIMPPSRWLYKTKSLQYLAWIMSDSSAGTLRDYLIKKKWAENVVAELRNENPWNTSLYSTFTISIDLLDEGNNRITEILDAVYSYINLLKREGPQKKLYDKIRTNEEAKFRYKEDCYPVDHPIDVENMHLYESADYITGPFLYYEYDPVSITTCVELMSPTKGCIFLNHENFRLSFESNQLFNIRTAGRSIELPDRLIERWEIIEPLAEFKLPEFNRFWPDDFTIIDPPTNCSKYPVMVYSDIISEVWYKFDSTNAAPTCSLDLRYLSPLPAESLENAVMFDFFVEVLRALLSDELEIANKAGLYGSVTNSSSGLDIYVEGFTQKLLLLTETIAQHVWESHFRATKKLFEQVKFNLYKVYSASLFYLTNPAECILESILKPGRWTVMDKYNSLRSITFSKLRQFMKQFTDHVFIKSLVRGNVSQFDAVEIVRKAVRLSKCGALVPNTLPQRPINELPSGKHYCEIKIGKCDENANSHVINYYQFDGSTIKQAVLINAFRVFVSDYRLSQHPEIARLTQRFWANKEHNDFNSFCIQVPIHRRHNTNDMDLIGKRFFEKFNSTFTDDIWECLKKALIHKILEDYLYDSDLDWEEIIHSEHNFDRQSRELEAVLNLEAKDFRDFVTYIGSNDSNIRKLSIKVIGSINEMERKNSDEFPPFEFEYWSGTSEKNGKTPGIFIAGINKYKSDLERSQKGKVESNK